MKQPKLTKTSKETLDGVQAIAAESTAALATEQYAAQGSMMAAFCLELREMMLAQGMQVPAMPANLSPYPPTDEPAPLRIAA